MASLIWAARSTAVNSMPAKLSTTLSFLLRIRKLRGGTEEDTCKLNIAWKKVVTASEIWA